MAVLNPASPFRVNIWFSSRSLPSPFVGVLCLPLCGCLISLSLLSPPFLWVSCFSSLLLLLPLVARPPFVGVLSLLSLARSLFLARSPVGALRLPRRSPSPLLWVSCISPPLSWVSCFSPLLWVSCFSGVSCFSHLVSPNPGWRKKAARAGVRGRPRQGKTRCRAGFSSGSP